MRNLLTWIFISIQNSIVKAGYDSTSALRPVSPSGNTVFGYGTISSNTGVENGYLPGYGLRRPGFSTSSQFISHSQVVIPAQNPNVFTALDYLRGSSAPTNADIRYAVSRAQPGTSYPLYSYIPQTSFTCSSVRQFGFYADPETGCQIFRRCEENNYMYSYICPNGTLFNQLTLVCDWWYNVNCPNSVVWVDFTNPRIYRQDLRLFDDLYNGVVMPSGAAETEMSSSSSHAGSPYGRSYLNSRSEFTLQNSHETGDLPLDQTNHSLLSSINTNGMSMGQGLLVPVAESATAHNKSLKEILMELPSVLTTTSAIDVETTSRDKEYY